MKSKKTFFIGIGVLAVLAVIFRIFDLKIAALIYRSGNFFGGICEFIGSALPFALCAFCFASLIFCRHTMATRRKNQVMSVVLGAASFVSSLAAVCIPLKNSSDLNIYAKLGAAAVLTAVFIYLAAILFKTTRQKMLMTFYAKLGIISSLISAAICFIAKLQPGRPTYAALCVSMEKFGNYDSPEAFVPLFVLCGAGSATVMWTVCFAEIFPKLKFSGKILFVVSAVLAAVMLFGVISSGNVYGFEFILTMTVYYSIQFVTKIILEKKEKEQT